MKIDLITGQYKNKIHTDEKDPTIAAKIQSNEDDGIAAGVDGTPTFFLNNVLVSNPSNYNDFKATVQRVVNNQ